MKKYLIENLIPAVGLGCAMVCTLAAAWPSVLSLLGAAAAIVAFLAIAAYNEKKEVKPIKKR